MTSDEYKDTCPTCHNKGRPMPCPTCSNKQTNDEKKIVPLPIQEQLTGLYDFCFDLLEVLESGEPIDDYHYQNLLNHLRKEKL